MTRGRAIALIAAFLAALAVGFAGLGAEPAAAQVSGQKVPVPKPAEPRVKGVPMPKQVFAKLRPLANTLQSLVPFDMSPFPFDGVKPNEGAFLNIFAAGRRGHVARGGTYWEDTTYSDNRVLLSMPKGFDVRKPAVMVVFFHGNGATLQRDVVDRQHVPQQVAASDINAVLVAPQFAFDAIDSSAGSFWQPGTFRQFLDEAVVHLVELYGDERTRKAFASMPVVIVAYSGGYDPAAYVLSLGGAEDRIKGVVLLDAAYGEIPRFAEWIVRRRDGFFLSTYTSSSASGNADLKHMLAERNITVATELAPKLTKGSVTMLRSLPDAVHENFVTRAFVDDPIKEVLLRLTEYAHKPGAVKSNYKPPPPPGAEGVPEPEPATQPVQ